MNAFATACAAEVAAVAAFRADPSPANREAMRAAVAAAFALAPKKPRGTGSRSGRRQHAEQAARTAEAIRRNAIARAFR